jgi:hypothetical protein
MTNKSPLTVACEPKSSRSHLTWREIDYRRGMAEVQFLAVAVDAAKNAGEVCPHTLPTPSPLSRTGSA